MKFWEIKEARQHCLKLKDPEGWYTAAVKWDGCIHFNRYFNAPHKEGETRLEHETDDYLHICDIDDLIERLQALKAEAKKHYGEKWPDL